MSAEIVFDRTVSITFEYATNRRNTVSRLPDRSPAIKEAV